MSTEQEEVLQWLGDNIFPQPIKNAVEKFDKNVPILYHKLKV